MIPGATAQNLTGHIRSMILTSAAVALGSAVGGLLLSCLLDFPTGATIVLLLALAYLLTIAVSWLRSRQGSA